MAVKEQSLTLDVLAASSGRRSCNIDPNDQVFLADAFWLPPDGDPLRPLAVQITFSPKRHRTAASRRSSAS